MKTRSLKCWKIEDFPKGLTHGFGPKLAIFRGSFLFNIGLENDFFDILDWKNAFLGSKNKKFQKSKNWHFSKGVNPWFWSQYGHFSNIFFRQYWLGKWFLRYSRTKKCLSRLSKQEDQNVEKLKIFQRG